jgi:AcrR family transcriptional regulator
MGLREEKKDRLRKQISENAVQLFKEKGFDEVTIDDIIRHLQISQATFFNYYPSKDAILQQEAEEIVRRYQGILEEEIRAEAATADKINHLLEVMGQGLQADKRFYRTLFTRGVLNFGNVRAERLLTDLAASLIRQGQLNGEIRSDYNPQELAEVFTGIYYAIILRWLYSEGGHSLVERLRRGAAIFLAGVAPDAAIAVAPQRRPRRRAS